MAKGHGQYREIKEDEFLKEVCSSDRVIVHFYHKDFERCKIADKHMLILSEAHLETKFLKINAEHAPFFTNKLQIHMLPCIICFFDGVSKFNLQGFEELGGVDDFPTAVLQKVLGENGAIDYTEKDDRKANSAIFGYFNDKHSDDDDDDF